MRGSYGRAVTSRGYAKFEISDAAIGAYRRLTAATGRLLITSSAHDGGLICEDRTQRARPTVWRISPGGAVLPDRRYSYARRGFVTSPLPHGV
jgi:hypothetical protein